MSIPAYFTARRQWVGFKITYQNGKAEKFPLNPNFIGCPASDIRYVETPEGTVEEPIPYMASSNDPSTWSTFQNVQRFPLYAYCLTKDEGLVFIDIDDCVVGTEITPPQAQELGDRLEHTYMDVSCSGTGLHFIGKGKLPKNLPTAKFKGLAVEVYNSKFIIFAKDGLDDIADIQDVIDDILIETGFHETEARSPKREFSGDVTPLVEICLEIIPPDVSYHEWIVVGSALKDNGVPFDVWDNWSSDGTNYDASLIKGKWDGIGGIDMSLGAIVNLAREYADSEQSKRLERVLKKSGFRFKDDGERESLEGSILRNIGKRYLEPQDYEAETKIILMQSPYETGKTQSLKTHLGDRSYILIGHRQALIKQQCERLGCRNYLDMESKDIAAERERLGVCLDSLVRIIPSNWNDAVVVLDEWTQVMKHLAGDTCEKNGVPEIRAALIHLLRNASKIILADADYSDEAMKHILLMAGLTPKDVTHAKNDVQTHERPLHLYPDTVEIKNAIKNSLKTGKKIAVFIDSIAATKEIRTLATNIGVDESHVLIVNSDNSASAEVQAMLCDPVKGLKGCQLLVASPSMSTGISIKGAGFDSVYVISLGVLGPCDLMQMLHRVRDAKWYGACVKEQGLASGSHDPAHIERIRLQAFRETCKNAPGGRDLDKNGNWQLGDPDHFRYVSEVDARENRDSFFMGPRFLRKAKTSGYSIVAIAKTTGEAERDEFRSIRADLRTKEVEAIVSAKDMTEAERKAYDRDHASLDDKRAAIKHDLVAFGGKDNLPELARFQVEGELLKLKNGVFAAIEVEKTDDELSEMDKEDLQNHNSTEHRLRHHRLRRDLFRQMLPFLGNLKKDQKINAEGFREVVRKNQDSVEAIWGIRFTKSHDKEPMRLVSAFLRRIGMSLKSLKHREADVSVNIGTPNQTSASKSKLIREYFIDDECLDRLDRLVAHRKRMETFRRARDVEPETAPNPCFMDFIHRWWSKWGTRIAKQEESEAFCGEAIPA